MTTSVNAVYENGVFKPDDPVPLKEKTRVHLVIESASSEVRANEDDPTGWKAVDELIGFIKGGPKEAIGREHDKYLYGK